MNLARIDLVAIALAITTFASRADAQTCLPLTAEVTGWQPAILNTEIDIHNNSCFETEVFSHFAYSQGNFADLVALGDLSNPINASAPVIIPSDAWYPGVSTGQFGEFRAPTKDSLRYTGTCNCPGTAATQSTEIACWCEPPLTNQHPTLPTFSNQTTQSHSVYFTELHIDRDRNGTTDHLYRGAWDEQPNWDPTLLYPELPTAPVRGEFMWNSVLKLSYEDWFRDDTADFNDYVALLEFRTCFPERFPEALRPPQSTVCHDPCGANPCLESDTNKGSTERWGVDVKIDSQSAEIGYERNGRILRLTVIGYEDYLTPNRDIGICPVLNFQWPRPRLANETGDWTTQMNYDTGFCDGNDPNSGLPNCGNTFMSQSVLPISFRQSETDGPSCSSSSIVSDVHRTEPANKCGPDLFFVHYELPLAALDAQISDSTLRYSNLSDSDIVNSVTSADIYMFYDIRTSDFQCPSGVNALLGSVSPTVARVSKTTVTAGDPGLVVEAH